jgi:hypothetical protein
LRKEKEMKLNRNEKREIRVEFCERCAVICDAACIAEAERDRLFQSMAIHGYRLA